MLLRFLPSGTLEWNFVPRHARPTNQGVDAERLLEVPVRQIHGPITEEEAA